MFVCVCAEIVNGTNGIWKSQRTMMLMLLNESQMHVLRFADTIPHCENKQL